MAELEGATRARGGDAAVYCGVFENAIEGIFQVTPSRRFILANPAMARILGYTSPEELLAVRDVAQHIQIDAGRWAELGRLLQERGSVEGFQLQVRHRDGSQIWIALTARAVRDSGGSLLHYEGIAEDVTASKRADEQLRRVNRAHRALSTCNQVLVRAEDEAALLRDICTEIVNVAGYRMCWVGYAEQDEAKTVRPVAQAGYEAGYLKTAHITWADSERGRGPTGAAVRTGQPCVQQNAATNPAFAPWRMEALRRGYASSIALPLRAGARVFGALTLYASEPDAFDEDEVRLLTQLADDLAYGLAALRTRTQREEAEAALRLSERKYRHLFENLCDAAFLIDSVNERIVDTNRQAEVLLGRPRGAIVGMQQSQLYPPTEPDERRDRALAELEQGRPVDYESVVVRGGSTVPVHVSASPLSLEGKGLVISLFRDITERKEAEARIEHLAYHDALTDLPNRLLFQDRLGQAVTQAQRGGRLLALHFLDLDHFKVVNDTLGHAVGDMLLQAVAERLRGVVRTGDTVARLGGDEFAIIQSGLPRVDGAATLASKLLTAFSKPFRVGNRQMYSTASIGITICPLDEVNPTQLLQNADMAMYLAKREGRNNYQFYTASLNVTLRERMQLEADLHQALDRAELMLFYQPQVDLRRGGIVGAEALARWRHPTRGLVLPSSFIPLAEESGLIIPIGAWALKQACAHNRAWQAAGLPARRVAVNVSGVQLRQPGFLPSIREALQASRLESRYLEVELTESTVMQDFDAAARTIRELQEMGINVAMDDFGTGYSSLSCLRRLHVNLLKIDQSFVRNLPEDADNATFTKMIIDLGHLLRLKVMAEGVEKKEQLQYLSELGCDEGQGYHFSQPVDARAFAALLAAAH